MDNMKQNKKAAAVLFAFLALMVVAVLCFSLIQLSGADQAKKKPVADTTADSTTGSGRGFSAAEAEDTLINPAAESQTGTKAEESDQIKSTEKTKTTEKTQTTEPSKKTSVAAMTFTLPITGGNVTKPYSDTVATFSQTMNDYRVHTGVDFYAPVGTAVVCCADGMVENVYDDPFLGTCVLVDHGGDLKSLYCNLSEETPKEITVGATVLKGDTIGGVGETMITESADMSHLHFSMTKEGKSVDPLSYLPYESQDSGEE